MEWNKRIEFVGWWSLSLKSAIVVQWSDLSPRKRTCKLSSACNLKIWGLSLWSSSCNCVAKLSIESDLKWCMAKNWVEICSTIFVVHMWTLLIKVLSLTLKLPGAISVKANAWELNRMPMSVLSALFRKALKHALQSLMKNLLNCIVSQSAVLLKNS